MFTKSRHVPGVEYAGLIHPGLIGCLPSKELLDEWNSREKELYDTDFILVKAMVKSPSAARLRWLAGFIFEST